MSDNPGQFKVIIRPAHDKAEGAGWPPHIVEHINATDNMEVLANLLGTVLQRHLHNYDALDLVDVIKPDGVPVFAQPQILDHFKRNR